MQRVQVAPPLWVSAGAATVREWLAAALATPRAVALLRVGVAWLVSRILLFVSTLLAVPFGQATTNPSYVDHHPIYSLSDLLWRWYFWDGSFYTSLARAGYTQRGYSAWFPLWPGLIHVAAHGSEPFFYGLALAQVATLAACVVLTLLALDARLARPEAPAILLLASPFAFFLAAPYSEGLFLALAAGVLLCLRHERWLLAAALTSLASLTRPTGLVLVPVVLLAYGLSLWRARRVTLYHVCLGVAVLGISLVGIAAYCAYCSVAWHDPLVWLHVESTAHDHGIVWPWQGLALAWQQVTAVAPTYVRLQDVLTLVPLVATAGVLLASARRLPLPALAFGAGVILMCLCSPMTHAIMPVAYVSAGRYMLIVVPFWLVLGRWSARWPGLYSLLLSGGVAVQALLLFFELNRGWFV